MKASHAAIFGGLGCALVVAALVVRSFLTEVPGEPVVPGPVGAPEDGFPEDELRWDDLEAEPELELEAEPAPESREDGAEPTVAGTASTALPAPTAGAAVVRGLLTDARTGEPLPRYFLRFEDTAGRREDVSTDESGRYATGAPMAGGTLRVHFFDDVMNRRNLPPEDHAHVVVDGEAPDLVLSVASGPTYRLAIRPEGAVVPTELLARLRAGNPDGRRLLGTERVRAGEPPWVRFGAVPEEYDRVDRVILRTPDGTRIGGAGVSTLAGVAPGILEVDLEERAVLTGKLVDPEGRPIESARVSLAGESVAGTSFSHATSSKADGSYRFDFLLAGTATVSVRSLRHTPQEASVRLFGSRVTQQDFVLPALPAAGSIEGRVESETGAFEDRARAILRPVAPDSKDSASPGPEVADVRWETAGGRRIGRFAFDALPAGEYEVRISVRGWLALEPRTATVSPPSPTLRFLVRDAEPLADFAFRVRDAETGETLEGVHAWVSVLGRGNRPGALPKDGRVLTGYPLARGFRWRVDRAGHRPRVGDAKAFAVEEVREGRTLRVAEIELAPGWGETYRVVRRGSGRGISGATIFLDGREAGKTRGDGTCTVSARARPDRVEVAYRDWTVRGAIDRRAPWLRRERRWVVVALAPPPR